jgi:hypothetical protein
MVALMEVPLRWRHVGHSGINWFARFRLNAGRISGGPDDAAMVAAGLPPLFSNALLALGRARRVSRNISPNGFVCHDRSPFRQFETRGNVNREANAGIWEDGSTRPSTSIAVTSGA